MKTRSTILPRFYSGTDGGGGGPEVEVTDPGSPGKMEVVAAC